MDTWALRGRGKGVPGWARLWEDQEMKKFQGESQGDTYDWDRAGLPGSWAVGPLSVPGFHFRPRYHYSRYRCQAQVTRGCGPQAETREPPSSSLPKAGGGRKGRQQVPQLP